MVVSVEEIMLRDYPAIDKDETLEQATRLMEKYDLDRVLAFEKKRLVGIMTKKDIMIKLATLSTRKLTPGRMHVSSFMTPDPITVEAGANVVDAARKMVEHEIGSLPVVSSGDVIGLVTRREIAQLAGEFHDVRVVDVMKFLPTILRTTHRLLHARQVFLQYNLIFSPVVDEDDKLVGYLTIDEIADAFLAFHDIVPVRFRKERIEHLLVDDVMRLRPPTLSVNDSVAEAVRKILERKTKGAVVVHENRIVGIVTLNELVRLVALRSLN